jgi:hypothetical protein
MTAYMEVATTLCCLPSHRPSTQRTAGNGTLSIEETSKILTEKLIPVMLDMLMILVLFTI